MVAHDAVAAPGVGPQVLRLARRVVGDHRVRRVEDLLRAAVVLVEDDGRDVGEGVLELHDVAVVGAAEAVHRLVRVADDRDVVVAAGEEQDDLVLGLVGVLVLVDEDVLEALPVVLEHVGVVAQQADGVDEQVVEVHRPRLVQAVLVLPVHVGVLAVEDVLRPRRDLGGVEELVLPEADEAVDAARREALGVEVEVADHVPGQAHGVGLVVDRELAGVAEAVGVGPQDPHARRVERAHPHRAGDRADERGDALAHLLGRLVGERDGEDPRGVHALVHEVGDAVREHPRLARPGAGDDEQRPAAVDDGVELVRVQAVRRRIGEGGGRVARERCIRHVGAILRRGCAPGPRPLSARPPPGSGRGPAPPGSSSRRSARAARSGRACR